MTTKIEWCARPGTKPETLNPIRATGKANGKRGWYCEHVTDGCRNCYAETMNGWRGNGIAYKRQNRAAVEIFLDEATLIKPLHWRAPRTIFWCSMTDLYGEFVPFEWIDRVKAVQALTPQHTHIELTKRGERRRDYMHLARGDFYGDLLGTFEAVRAIMFDDWPELTRSPDHPHGRVGMPWPLPNVWAGVSCHDQQSADEQTPALLDTPAAVRFVSYEPALGPVDFTFIGEGDQVVDALNGPPDMQSGERLDWVIAGGESGPNARPAHPKWFRSARDQCQAAGVPFFFKQWGEFLPVDQAPRPQNFKGEFWTVSEFGHSQKGPGPADYWPCDRVGRAQAGHLLENREWQEFPQLATPRLAQQPQGR